jgi:sugar phosphate isomerase/epimerase
VTVLLGVLGDSYRRQLRRPSERPAIDRILEKVTALADEFDLRPLGVDFGVGGLPSLGSPLGLFYSNYGGRVTREGRIRLAVEQIARLADAAANYGMTVTTENYDYFTSDDFLEIFTRLDRANVGLHNDTGNWLLLDEEPIEATRKLAPYTYHAHVRDYVLRDGVFTSVPIGQGNVDFPPVLDELKRIGQSRDRLVLTVEMDLDAGNEDEEDAAVRECVRYMADWFTRSARPVAGSTTEAGVP